MASDITITSLTAVGAVGQVFLSAIAAAPAGLGCLPYMLPAKIEFWAATTNDRAGAVKIGEPPIGLFTHNGLNDTATRYYWARAVDGQGEFGAFFPVSATAGVAGAPSNAAIIPITDALSTAITTETTQRTTADAALTTSVSTAQSTANGAIAAISSEATTRASADETLTNAVTTALSTANNAASAVTTEASTRAAADGALATSLSGVQASFNDISASGLIKMEAVATAAGASASFEIFLRKVAGGTAYSTGMRMDIFPDNYTQISFKTDRFKIGDGSTIKEPFFLDTDGTLYLSGDVRVGGDLLVVGSIYNSRYADGSIGETVSLNTSSNVEIHGYSSHVEILEVTSHARGGATVVHASGAVFADSAAGNKNGCVRVGIYKGDELKKYVEGYVDDNYYDQLNFSMVWRDDNPGTGNVFYQLKASRVSSVYGRGGNNDSGSLHATQCTLVATNDSKG